MVFLRYCIMFAIGTQDFDFNAFKRVQRQNTSVHIFYYKTVKMLAIDS